MAVLNEIREAVQVLKLNKSKMAEVAGRKEATRWGIIFLAVAPVVNIVLSALIFPSGLGSIFSRYLLWPIFIPFMSFVAMIFLMSLVAEKAFHGGKDHIGFFRIMAYASVSLWATVVPFLLMVLGIVDAYGLFRLIYLLAGAWILYLSFYALMEHHKLSKENAIFTVVAAIFIALIVESILGNVLVGGSYRLY